MAHGHSHSGNRYDRAFAIGVGLNLAFVVAEAGFGFMAGSMALLADAGHNLSDVAGLLLAWGASVLVRRAPTARRTYGWRGSSILAALGNAVLLLLAVGAIALETVRRLRTPEPVEGVTVIWVATAGLIVNGATAMLFFHGRERDLNVRGAFLHMAADAAVSFGVVLSGALMLATGWTWVDPAVSLAIVGIIAVGTWGLLRDSLNLALAAVPAGIEPGEVHVWLAALPGVVEVHDLHIWSMSTSEIALTGHLVRPDIANDDEFLADLAHRLHDRFGIHHATVQIERQATHSCNLHRATGD